MKSLLIFGGILLIGAGLLLGQNAGGSAQSPRAVLDQYCVTCHNEKTKTAGLMLDKMDPARVAQNAEAWEKVVRKLRAGMMPPQGLPRPSAPAYEALTVALEDELDREHIGRGRIGHVEAAIGKDARLKKERLLVLDVRHPFEHERGHGARGGESGKK